MVLEPGSCLVCENVGYTTAAASRWADAKICSCRKPCRECGGTGYLLQRDDSGRTYSVDCACLLLAQRVALLSGVKILKSLHDKEKRALAAWSMHGRTGQLRSPPQHSRLTAFRTRLHSASSQGLSISALASFFHWRNCTSWSK